MSRDEVFIQAIRADPDDDAPRLVYADWLDESGQADRAEFIRLQCRLAGLSEAAAERSEMAALAGALLRRNWEEWVGPFRDIVGPRRDRYGECWLGEPYHPDVPRHRFPRGFVWSLTLDAERFLQYARRINELTPLYHLTLWESGRFARALSNRPELRGLRGLLFGDYYNFPLTADGAAELAASPHLDTLLMLHLGYNSLGDEGVEALLRAPWLCGLRYLDLTDNGLSDRAARALAESTRLANLRTLRVGRNYFSTAGIAALQHSPNLRLLTRLEYDSPTNLLPPAGTAYA